MMSGCTIQARLPKVIYEDNHLLVLSKPACMPTVPDASRDESLLDWGRAYLKQTRNKPGNVFLGVVHRLDRPVSGVVCLAITSKAAARLSDQMRQKLIKKTYIGISRFRPEGKSGMVENHLLKDRRANMVRIVDGEKGRKARFARTRWEYLGESGGFHLIRLVPETGRPHQLRVHCASMGCVLAGDLKYGDISPLEDRSVALHASSLKLVHPVRKEEMVFSAPMPDIIPWSLFGSRFSADKGNQGHQEH